MTALCALVHVPAASAARPITLVLFDERNWEGHHDCILAMCVTIFGITLLEGSPVTGNGTSTKNCGPGGAENGMFVVT